MQARVLTRILISAVGRGPCRLEGLRACMSNQAAQGGNTPSPEAASQQGDQQPLDLEDLRRTPGWLKGPVGRRVVKALGEDEWQETVHPTFGEPCWKNIKTGILTVPGMPKPDTWTEVVDKRTGLLYYWNRRTGETTDLGEPKPGPEGRSKKSTFVPRTDDFSFNTNKPAGEAVKSAAAAAEQGRQATASRRGPPERDITLFELINTPSGYGFLGFTALAFLWPYAQQWLEGPQAGA